MREMKDWIPSKLKYHCAMNSGVNITSLDISDNGEFPVYGGNGLRGYFDKYNQNGNYLLIGRQGALAGNVHRVCGKFWATEHALVTQVFWGADINFFFYLLISLNLNQYAFDTAAQPGIAVSKIRELGFYLPSLPEQRLIAFFLDAKCAEIDALTADIQEQIDTLEQYKRSVITKVVTKGLNPDAKMKDSGIKWVGEIPENWETKPIRAVFQEVSEKNSEGLVKNALKFTYGNIIRKDNFDADEDKYVADTILNYTVVNPGTIMLNGLNLNFDFITQRIGLVKERGIITSAYLALIPIDSNYMSSEYAVYLLKSYDGCKAFHNMGGGVRKILNFNELKKQYIVIPPLVEQHSIVSYINAKCAEIDGIISQKREQIATIEEYKKSLIFEYVTGKKEVPVT